jgi:hypothetical protein
MELSQLLMLLGGLLCATAMKWNYLGARRTPGEIFRDARAGRLRVTLYAKIVTPVGLTLMIVGIYLQLTWH